MTSLSTHSTNPLPSYKRPPVDEVVCGFRFQILSGFKLPHLGVLWERFRAEFPIAQHATPIATDGSFPVDESTGIPIPRIWFISNADNELIQFQLDRFYFNWRRRADEYPRYDSIIHKFENAKSQLDAFANDLQLGEVKPVECELTYINHIPKSQGWESINDLSNVIGDLTWEAEKHEFLPHPVNVAWQVRFELPEGKGSLNVKLNQGTRKFDRAPGLILELAARGLGADRTAVGMRDWYDLAHEWIVRGFTDLTAKEIQAKFWERER
jgi:uncharacterized protein (TIGR04255 family)